MPGARRDTGGCCLAGSDRTPSDVVTAATVWSPFFLRGPSEGVRRGRALAGRSTGKVLQASGFDRLDRTGATGLEPATSGVTGRRSNQLSYAPYSGRRSVGPSAARCG